jgi:hypothetical protein
LKRIERENRVKLFKIEWENLEWKNDYNVFNEIGWSIVLNDSYLAMTEKWLIVAVVKAIHSYFKWYRDTYDNNGEIK